MKLFAIVTVVLLSCCSSHAQGDSDWKIGPACTDRICQSLTGNFDQSHFFQHLQTPGISYKTIAAIRPTSFFVYIRNIEVKNPAVAFMRVCTERSCTDLIDSEDKTLVFNPAQTVYFYIAGDNAQFEIQYYGGCQIIDDTDVGFERVASEPFQSPAYCWIIVPRLYKDGTMQWTEATNFFLSKVVLPANSSMSLYNLFTGERVMAVRNSTDLDLVSVERQAVAVSYQKTRMISTALVLAVDTCPEDTCNDISFKVDLQTFTSGDYQCFRKKQACEFGMIDDAFQCDDEAEKIEKCAAYENFDSIVLRLEAEASGAESGSSAIDQRLQTSKQRAACKHRFKRQEKRFFCRKSSKTGELVDCQKFKRCALHCVEQRVFLNICKKRARIFV